MTEPAACLNCQEPFAEPKPRFCPACGQESNVKPPTLAEFAQQFGGAYFSTEGALWRTLRLLLTQPGELTRQYLAGRRKHYVLPLRLYLTISLLVLLGLRLSTQGNAAFETKLDPGEDTAAMVIDLGSIKAGTKAGVFFCEGLPAWTCARLKRRIALEPQALQREAAAYGERFIGNLGGTLFVLLPAFALWMKLAYLNRRMRYTEHLVFALHLHAFWFLLFACALTGWGWLITAALLAAPWYALASMKRVYGGRRAWRVLRAAFVTGAYLATLGLVTAGAAVWTLLF